MFKRIVVPLDGTPAAEAALAPARELARLFDSHVLLVRAIQPSGLPFASPDLEATRELEQADEADAYLHEMTAGLRSEGVNAQLALSVAAPGAGIAEAVSVDHADLVVMSAHPRWRRDVLDNRGTTLQVLAHTRAPILAWRAPVRAAPGSRDVDPVSAFLATPDTPIVVPLDGSHFAEAALPTAEALARRLGSYLVLVRAVGADGAPMIAPLVEAPGNEAVERRDTTLYLAEAYLGRVREDLRGRELGASICAYRGAPVDVIARVAHETNAGLVVMASHGTSGDPRHFMGSVAVRAIEELTLPVLVVHSGG